MPLLVRWMENDASVVRVPGSNALPPSRWVEHAGSRRVGQEHACVRRWCAGTRNHQTACGCVFGGGSGDGCCKFAIGLAIHGFRSGQCAKREECGSSTMCNKHGLGHEM